MAHRVPRGPGETRLLEFCNSFGYKADNELHVFYSEKGTAFLYRHSTAGVIKKKGKEYPQWRWKNILGSDKAKALIEYVLLHGAKSIKDKIYEEGYWIIRKATFESRWPKNLGRLNLKTDSVSGTRAGSLNEQLKEFFVTSANLKSTINSPETHLGC